MFHTSIPSSHDAKQNLNAGIPVPVVIELTICIVYEKLVTNKKNSYNFPSIQYIIIPIIPRYYMGTMQEIESR